MFKKMLKLCSIEMKIKQIFYEGGNISFLFLGIKIKIRYIFTRKKTYLIITWHYNVIGQILSV